MKKVFAIKIKAKKSLISIIIILNLIHFSLFFNDFNSQKLRVNDIKSSSGLGSRSIILMIGDGMGFEHLKLARWVEIGKRNHFLIERSSLYLNITTYSANSLITDSAAAATAMATGNKTNNGMLSISPLFQPLKTILEFTKELGKSTGIVTTTEITHATPAAFMTHVKSRYNTIEIVRQIVENSRVNILLGGGKDYFSASQLIQLEATGYNLLENRSELNNVHSGDILGLFASKNLPYELNRDKDLIPSLSEMTMKAIEILSQDPEGFFLMVEGGRIDHGGHANNKTNVALETIEFQNAVNKAISYSKENSNVLLIMTSDHETGGLEILNETLNEIVPSSYNSAESNRFIRFERINNISVNWATTSHTSLDVPFFGYRMEFNGLDNQSVIDNTEIFNLMKNFLTIISDNNSDLIIVISLVIGITFPFMIGTIIFIFRKNKKNFKKYKENTIV